MNSVRSNIVFITQYIEKSQNFKLRNYVQSSKKNIVQMKCNLPFKRHSVTGFISFLDTFLEVITKANRTPVEKFEFPLTSNHEYGWNTQPLVM